VVKNLGHAQPCAFSENSELILVDIIHPAIGYDIPDLPDDASREAGRKVALWLLETLGPRVTAAKLAGLRFAFHLERRSMAEVGREIGCGRAAISKFRTLFCDKFGLPAGRTQRQRAERSRTQKEAWQNHPRRQDHGLRN
jgi:hypothetical protein